VLDLRRILLMDTLVIEVDPYGAINFLDGSFFSMSSDRATVIPNVVKNVVRNLGA
jgi:hypothetical protein